MIASILRVLVAFMLSACVSAACIAQDDVIVRIQGTSTAPANLAGNNTPPYHISFDSPALSDGWHAHVRVGMSWSSANTRTNAHEGAGMPHACST